METGFFQNLTTTIHWYEADFFADECFILGSGSQKHAKLTASEITATALLAYKLLHKKHFYFEARERLIVQIFKIAARKVDSLSEAHAGITGAMAIVCLSVRTWWIGIVGDVDILVFQKNALTNVTAQFKNTEYFGSSQMPKPKTHKGEREKNAVFLVCSHSLTTALNEKQITKIILNALTTQSSMQKIAEQLVEAAVKRRKAAYAIYVIR